MGRKKISIDYIHDAKERNKCFKKRRIGAVKKLMELTKLSDCKIEMRIFHDEDKSLMEYRSKNYETDGQSLNHIESYMRLNDDDYDILTSTEMYITRQLNK